MIFSILYSLYYLSETMAEVYNETGYLYTGLSAFGYLLFAFIQIGIFFAGFVAYFLLRGFGLYKAAKKREREDAWKAFVPFAAILLLGSLSRYNEDKPENKTFPWLAVSFTAAHFLVMIVIDVLFAVNPMKTLFAGETLTAEAFDTYLGLSVATASSLYNFLAAFEQILSVAVLVFTTIIFVNFVRVYRPTKVSLYSVISALVYFFFGSYIFYGIFVFVCGNEEPKNYSEFVSRRYGAYYGGAYAPPKTERTEDPFSEFSKEKDADPFSEIGTGGHSETIDDTAKTECEENEGETPTEIDDGSDDLF